MVDADDVAAMFAAALAESSNALIFAVTTVGAARANVGIVIDNADAAISSMRTTVMASTYAVMHVPAARATDGKRVPAAVQHVATAA